MLNIMFKNYLKIAFRNIIRQKGFSFINITGLAIGMACTIIILIWVQDELTFDRFHENADNLYRVEEDQYYSGEVYHVNVTPYPCGPVFREEIPEVVNATRFQWTGGLLFRRGETSFFESGTVAVDSTFFQMFTFPLIEGDKRSALDEPFSIVLSKEMAEKYFGEENPIGEALNVNNQYEFIVTGVFDDIPQNSILQFDMLVNFDFMHDLGRYSDSWGNNSIRTFVQLREDSNIKEVNEKLTGLLRKNALESTTDYMVAPFTRIHLHQYWGFGHSKGLIQFVYIFSIIALFVLIIACINFMNLSTARSIGRAKEIGIRKVTGAHRRKIIAQFYGESIFLSFIALVFAIILVMVMIQPFNDISSKRFSINIFSNWQILLGLIGVTLFTGIIAGSYPAIFLSAFKPVKVLRGSLKSGKGSSIFRIILVVVQFTISIFLIIGTAVIYKQTKYLKNKDIGFDKEHVVCIPMRGDIRQSYDVLKSELIKDSRILGVTASAHRPSYIGSNSGGVDWEGKDPDQRVLISMNPVDYDFVETMKIDMKSGRSFSREFSSDFVNDSAGTFLINEELEKIMGVEFAVGMDFSFGGTRGQIVGVMENFHFQPARQEIEPLAIWIDTGWQNYFLIRIQAGDIPLSLDRIEDIWDEVIPDYPFDYFFLDEDFDSMYRTEERIGLLLNIFTVIAIFIACLGLFGLASFTAEQRTKEICIRKVLGASVSGITVLLSKEFAKWVVLGYIIAAPLAGYIMTKWLQDYAYKTKIGWLIFIGTAIISVVIALLTVSYQSIRAAYRNPVDSLRYE